MTKERIVKELSRVREQLAGLQEREKDLAEQLQMAEDAEKMKFIEKNKISLVKRKRTERNSTIRRKGGLQP